MKREHIKKIVNLVGSRIIAEAVYLEILLYLCDQDRFKGSMLLMIKGTDSRVSNGKDRGRRRGACL